MRKTLTLSNAAAAIIVVLWEKENPIRKQGTENFLTADLFSWEKLLHISNLILLT